MSLYDLHIHTELSDGSAGAADVVAFAARRGLSGIAVCDHDVMDAVQPAAKAAAALGIEVIPAVELSAIDPQTGRKVHLLVYYPKNTQVLEPIFREMARKRREAGLQMIERVCQRLPVTPEHIARYHARSASIFRVHIMRALLDLGYAPSVYGALYRELFAEPDGCCLVRVAYTDMTQAAHAARLSGGAVALAHPSVYDSFDAGERLARAGLLDGIEYDYPRRQQKDVAQHDRLASEYGLIKTGGTDFHGFYSPKPHPVGTCAVDAYAVARMRTMLESRY